MISHRALKFTITGTLISPSCIPVSPLSDLTVLEFNVWWNILPTFRQKATNYLLVPTIFVEKNKHVVLILCSLYYNCFNMFVAICNEISTVV
jgi:hypothetical protein